MQKYTYKKWLNIDRGAVWRGLAALCGAIALVACGAETEISGDIDSEQQADVADSWEPDVGFDDHTRTHVDSAADFMALAVTSGAQSQVKFVITHFRQPEAQAHLFEGDFYHYHDEWLWFRLVNGQTAHGSSHAPLSGLSLPTVQAIYDYFAGKSPLPLGLVFLPDGRLYAPEFYKIAFDQKLVSPSGTLTVPRALGAGSLLHLPAHPDRPVAGDIWAFELEYVDSVSENLLNQFLPPLQESLPANIGSGLRWLARPNPAQEGLALKLRASNGPWRDRTLTYTDLVVPGEVVGYSEGISAGRIKRLLDANAPTQNLTMDDIVVMSFVPDELPPVAASVTALPQTPLAHFNLLALSRGTPNAYVAGVLDDQSLMDWAWFRVPVLVKVTSETVQWKAISEPQFKQYQTLRGTPSFVVPQLAGPTAVKLVPLDNRPFEDRRALTPLLGGKSTGMLALSATEIGETPFAPIGVTVVPYKTHLENVRNTIEAMLALSEFNSNALLRYLALEGPTKFESHFAADSAAMAWLNTFYAENPNGSWLGDLVSAGGLQRVFRDHPLEPAFRAELEATLADRFRAFAPTQGLRFRSSSTVEDAEGFNGAGLYDSNTGYLDPSAIDPALEPRTLASALKKTWASYWNFAAFEERRSAGIDHFAGNMGVLIHPTFTDESEWANGVLKLNYSTWWEEPKVELMVNVQAGALSVTNPPAGSNASPEVSRIVAAGGGEPSVMRLQASTEVPPGTQILDDAKLKALFNQTRGLAALWLVDSNRDRPAGQYSRHLTLDFEFKGMGPEWPAWSNGATQDSRVVYKQVRPLSRPILVPPDVQSEPIPRDVLAMAARIRRTTCKSAELEVSAIEVFCHSEAASWIPFANAPFVARTRLEFPSGSVSLAIPPGKVFDLEHTNATLQGAAEGGSTWQLKVTPSQGTPPSAWLTSVQVGPAGGWSAEGPAGQASGEGLQCASEDVVQSASDYLEALLMAP